MTLLVFGLPLALAALLSLGSALGLSALELDFDADLDAGLDAEADADADAAGDGLLAALGVGRVPLMLVLMCLLASFGALGLSMHAALSSVGVPFALPLSALVALVLSFKLTGLLSSRVARWLPSVESYASARAALLGSPATTSSVVDAHQGRVVVHESDGTRHELAARFPRGTLQRGTEVVLTEVDASGRVFTVEPLD